MFKPLRSFPYVSRQKSTMDDLSGPLRGLDLEWSDGRISILGVSDAQRAVSVDYDAGARNRLIEMSQDKNLQWVGHNLIQADWQELKKDGISMTLDPARVHDTILYFYLTNAHLCKTSSKGSMDEDGGERKGRGFMNLGTMLALNTDLPHYKECREATHKETQLIDVANKKGEIVQKKRKVDIIDSVCVGPCPTHDPHAYNGIDTIAPVIALPSLQFQMKLRGVEKLYPLHVKLADLLARMSERGVYVNLPYINKLRDDFIEMKKEAGDRLPFNAASPMKIIQHFKSREIYMANAQEQTIRDLVGTDDDRGEYYDDTELQDLLTFKELGNGPDRWFGDKYLQGGEILHPHFNFFTSTGRLMSSNPNIQNVAARRIDRKTGENIGSRIRRALVAPEGYYWYKFDYSQAENRVYMYLAGMKDIPSQDFHSWMAKVLNLDAKSPFSLSLGGPREAGKSVVHATDYLEGIQLVAPAELRSKRISREVEIGARIVFRDWMFKGRVVTFTGINLARRALKKASFENRRYALEAQQKYFNEFPLIRGLQQRITKECEEKRAVIPPHGYFLLSYGRDEDRMKQAAATWGSQPVAHIMKLALLRADEHPHLIPIITVHDEIGFYVDARHQPSQVKKWIEEVTYFDTPEMPGFFLPGKTSYGKNWADQKKIE